MKINIISLLTFVMLASVIQAQEYGKKYSDLNYAGDDKAYHTLDVYLPNTGKATYPVVIHIYGSAWFSNNSKGQADLNTIGKALLDAGFAVVTPNHRSSADDKFPAQINDIKAVIRFVKGNAAQLGLDTTFVGISGCSSGGHLAALAGVTNGVKEFRKGSEVVDIEGNLGKFTKENSSVNAVCDWFGPVNLLNLDSCRTTPMFADGNSPESALMGFQIPSNPVRASSASAISYVSASNPPFLLIHGDKDALVPYCQSKALNAALKSAGVESDYIQVEGGEHYMKTVTEPNIAAMVEFFKSHLPHKPYFSPATTGVIKPNEDGFIQRWLLLEPIDKPNRSNTVFTDSYIREAFSTEYFPNQFTVVPKDGDKVKVGEQQLTWHALESNLFNVKLFRFASGLKKQVYGVLFWAVTVIDSPEDMKDIRMSVGSNSASMWWLNGEEAVILSGDRRMVKDDCLSRRLTLKKGKNIVRGAIINGPGMSDFCLRFLNENGEPVKNISISYK